MQTANCNSHLQITNCKLQPSSTNLKLQTANCNPHLQIINCKLQTAILNLLTGNSPKTLKPQPSTCLHTTRQKLLKLPPSTCSRATHQKLSNHNPQLAHKQLAKNSQTTILNLLAHNLLKTLKLPPSTCLHTTHQKLSNCNPQLAHEQSSDFVFDLALSTTMSACLVVFFQFCCFLLFLSCHMICTVASVSSTQTLILNLKFLLYLSHQCNLNQLKF